MPVSPAAPLVPVEEYLCRDWRPDKEFVDGSLVERSVPTYFHALLQMILGEYFRRIEAEYGFKAVNEFRTQIVERSRYRIPDVLLAATPLRGHRVLTVPPLAVFEILSPDDTVSETLARFNDYASIGVRHLIQMDPERYTAHRYEAGSLIATKFKTLVLPHTGAEIPFDSEAIFAQLRKEIEDSLANE